MDDNHVNIFVSRRSDFDIIRRRLETLLGDHFVPMPEFCPPTFMTRYTRFPDIAAMLAASRLPFAADGEPDKLEGSYRERWDQFVSQNSDFADWKEMEDRAAAKWVSDQLTGSGDVPQGENIQIDELAARTSDSAIDDDPYLPDFSIYNGDLIRARDDLIRAIQATVGLSASEIERISPNPRLTGETPTIAELHRLFDAAARSYVLSQVANRPELRELVDAMNARKLQPVRRLYRRVLFNKGFPLGSPPPDSAPPDEREVALSRAFALFKARFIHGMQRIWMEPEQVADEAYLVVLYRIEIGGKILKVMAHGAARKLKAAAADIRKLPSDIGLMIDQRGVDMGAFFRGLHAGAATVSDTFTFGFFFDEHKRQAWEKIGLEGSDTQQLSEFFATASREIALYALALGSVKLARTGSKVGMVGVTTFTAIEGAEAAGWSVEVYQQFVQDNYEKALIAGAFAILAAFGFREGIDDALKSIPPLANDLGKATRTAADALDEFGAQISDPNTLGSGLGGLGDFGKGSKKRGAPPDQSDSAAQSIDSGNRPHSDLPEDSQQNRANSELKDSTSNAGDQGTTLVPKLRAKTLFRGERSSRSPQTVFENGIPAKGNNQDLLRHASGNQVDTNYVATSIWPKIAKGFAGKNGWLYIVRTSRGIDVNVVLGSRSPFPEQGEFAIAGGIHSSEIYGAFKMKAGNLEGSFIPNPGFRK